MKRRTKVGLIGTAALATSLFLGKAVYSPSFYLAQQFECLRSRYIQKVVKEEIGDLPEYVIGVEYIVSSDDNEFRRKHKLDDLALMETSGGECAPEDIGRRKIRSKVYILPKSFDAESLICDEDFRSVLADHEITHAEQYFNGFPSIGTGSEGESIHPDVFNVINELSAMREEIKGFEKRKVSGRHAVNTITNYMWNYSRLWEPEIESHLFPGVTDGLKRLFFEDWMRRSTGYRREGGDSFIVNPKTGAWLKLPE